jgi:hypothetical protein
LFSKLRKPRIAFWIETRSYFGETTFNAWAWRIPFLFSFLLIFVTLDMRANFEESPAYTVIKAKGITSKRCPCQHKFLSELFDRRCRER